MSVMYAAMGISTWSPPTLFVSGTGGANGVAGDDIVTGVLIMGGGVLVGAAFAAEHGGRIPLLIRQPVRLAAVWAWLLSFASVAVAGYAIELHETYYGAGDGHASGAVHDAVFTWLHQDLGLFLLPALVLVMLAVERLVDHGNPGLIGWGTILGSSIAFGGGFVWVFLDSTLRGPGYVVSTAGLLIVGAALLATLWWGLVGHLQPVVRTSRPAPVNITRNPRHAHP
jgi:hypothetical protein